MSPYPPAAESRALDQRGWSRQPLSQCLSCLFSCLHQRDAGTASGEPSVDLEWHCVCSWSACDLPRRTSALQRLPGQLRALIKRHTKAGRLFSRRPEPGGWAVPCVRHRPWTEQPCPQLESSGGWRGGWDADPYFGLGGRVFETQTPGPGRVWLTAFSSSGEYRAYRRGVLWDSHQILRYQEDPLKRESFLPQANLLSLTGFPDFCLSTNMLLGIVFSVVDNVSTRAK